MNAGVVIVMADMRIEMKATVQTLVELNHPPSVAEDGVTLFICVTMTSVDVMNFL